MPSPLKPQTIRSIGVNGVIRQAEVDDPLIPVGAVTEVINMNFDRKGAVQVRPGITGLGTTIATGYPIQGLFNVSNGSMVAVFSQGGSARVNVYGGASWASNLTSGTANTVKRFFSLGGKTIVVNWGLATNQYSSLQFWTGRENNASWTTSGNPINPQQINSNNIFPQYGEAYKSRGYLSGDPNYPSRLFFSAVIDSSGNFSWTPSTDWVDINPGDGEDNTGLRRFALELLFFKPNYIYRFKTSGADPDPMIKIGTRSNESIVEGKKGLYFHHETGFYRYDGASFPQEISRPISDVVTAIPFSQFSVVSSWKDQDHIYWSLGNLTLTDVYGSSTWKNVVVRFTESSQVWTVYSYANNPKIGSTYNSGSAITQTIGLDNGVVATLNLGTTDLGEPIAYRVVTPWKEWEGIPTRKTITQAVALCEKAQDSKIFYQIDDNPNWFPFMSLTKYMTAFNGITKPFYRIRFKVTGNTRVEPAVFQGIEILAGSNEGIVL